MISSKVDLTEHNDFGKQFAWFDVLYDPEILMRLNNAIDFSVSSEEYDRLFCEEKFFGIKRHIDESDKLFHKEWKHNANCDQNISHETHCMRCGKPLIPWKNRYGLCQKCDEESALSYGERCPWKVRQAINRNDARDLFSLR